MRQSHIKKSWFLCRFLKNGDKECYGKKSEKAEKYDADKAELLYYRYAFDCDY